MALGSPKVSIFGAGFPRKVSTIAIAIGGLASFFVFGLLLRLTYPTSSSSVGGIFYGIGAQEPVEFPLSLRNHSEKVLYRSSEINTTEEKLNLDSSSDSPVVVNTTIPPPDSDSDGKLETPLTQKKEDVSTKMAPPDSDSDRKLEAPLTQEKEGKVPLDTTVSTDVGSAEGETNVSKDGDTPVESSPPHDDTETASAEPECDLYQGSWFYDPQGPLYTNNTCPVLTQMQNCQGNGRPDKGYESWRWKPSGCDLPRFDARKFLDLMKGKTLAFIGDSVARNQMESMLCLLWQVETPVNRGSRKMQRWFFKKSSVMVARIWSSWLVHQFNEKFDYAPEGVTKLKLDLPDERIMEAIPKFDVVVLSSGHWFAKQSVYILKDEIVGGQLWWPDKSKPMKVNNVEAFGISVETILKSMATHPNYKGLTIVRTFSPDHYEGGAWNTGGSCTGKEEPVLPGKLMKNGFTEIMHEKQATGYSRAVEKVEDSLKPKLKLMDITEAFGYRHDGHPGPYRSPDPNKITKRGPDGRPPPQDCLHWCMPGPVDTWNEMVLEVIRRDFEGSKRKNSSS